MMDGVKSLRLVARLWSALSLLFLLAFFVGEWMPPQGIRDGLALFFFPFGVAVGLVLAWRREGLGGAIAVGSLVAFYLTLYGFDRRWPRGPYFLLIAAPGLLFMLLAYLERSPSPREA